MIDLSTAVVGDKFLDDNDNVVEIVIVDHETGRYIGKGAGVIGGRTFYGVYYKNGYNDINDAVGLVSKHEPRHWLKDLPDADLFIDDITHIAGTRGGEWQAYRGESIMGTCCFDNESTDTFTSSINMIKMPTLTGDEWCDSKISIVDLKAWQEVNK